MNFTEWFRQLSRRQHGWFYGTLFIMICIVSAGLLFTSGSQEKDVSGFTVDMTLRNMALRLNVTPKSMARDLDLPLNVSKRKPVHSLGVKQAELDHAVHHIASHQDSRIKYFIYTALVLGALVFLTRLGRPDHALHQRKNGYPPIIYWVSLIIAAGAAGFLLGKSPNPMEGAVKVFKSMVGLYPDPSVKVAAFLFFILLAVVGNKLICGWACPFGALQELIYSIPVFRNIKRHKLPFLLTNLIRGTLFVAMLIFLFGLIGGKRGRVLYHDLNPFNLFNYDIESMGVFLAILLALTGSFFIYRPFCQLICPFGLISWLVERISLFRVRIDFDKCNQCGACTRVCPLDAAQDKVAGKIWQADCFSCMRCLTVCPSDAIHYTSVFKSLKSHSETQKKEFE